jgi:hypothetical protein
MNLDPVSSYVIIRKSQDMCKSPKADLEPTSFNIEIHVREVVRTFLICIFLSIGWSRIEQLFHHSNQSGRS